MHGKFIVYILLILDLERIVSKTTWLKRQAYFRRGRGHPGRRSWRRPCENGVKVFVLQGRTEKEDTNSFLIDKRGYVRPKKYNSKYKRTKLSSDAEFLDVAPSKENKTEDSEDITFSIATVSPADKDEVPDCESAGLSHSDKDESSTTCSDEQTEGTTEHHFIEFLKKQDDTINVDDLMRKLEEEQKWDFNNAEESSDEDDVEDADNYCPDEEEDRPIQPGHFLTVKTRVLLIWLFVITHSFTSAQISDLLTLLSLHMLSGYPALKSLYRFKRFFKHMKSPFVKHHHCSFCAFPVENDDTVCKNEQCMKDLSKDSATEYFLELTIISQLQSLYSRAEFYNGLANRNRRIKRNEKNIEDVYDAELYKRLSSDGNPLHSQHIHNISFTLNTDGIPIFKSSKTSLWPIYLMVNELPYRMRKLRENMILCGLWFGRQKPEMNVYGKPLHEELLKLEKGVDICPVINGAKQKIHVSGFLYCVSCDTPARNSILNLNQHNGFMCCPKCLQPGSNFRTESGGNVHVFPFQQVNPSGPVRTPEELKQNAEDARISGATVNGVKGPSFLMFCPFFNPVKGVCIDYMHLIYLGVVRCLMNLWFGVTNGFQSFSMYKFVEIVDSRLMNIKPSHRINRKPRGISDLKFWKAAEFRSWFFYYSVPCIFDLLSPNYFYHYCTLLEGIYLLNTESISESDLQKSEKLLQYFVFMVPYLYGERYLTLNFHSLLHLPETVRQLGPLWSTSCFPFESANGELTNFFHGTQNIDIQIINAVHVFQTLPLLSESVDIRSKAYPLIQSLTKSKTNKSSTAFKPFGKGYCRNVDNESTSMLIHTLKRPYGDLLFYSRAFLRGVMYHSLDYSRPTKRNSYTVKFIDNDGLNFGFVSWFVVEPVHEVKQKYSSLDWDDNVLLVCLEKLDIVNVDLFNMHHEKLQPDEYVKSNFMDLDLPSIHFVRRTEKKSIVPAQNILDLCVCIDMIGVQDFFVVCDEPNHQELNL